MTLSGPGLLLPRAFFFSSTWPSASPKLAPGAWFVLATLGIRPRGGAGGAWGETRPSTLVGEGDRETSGLFLFLEEASDLDEEVEDEDFEEGFEVEVELDPDLWWLLDDEELPDFDLDSDLSLEEEPEDFLEGDFSLSFFSSLGAGGPSLAFLGSLDLRGSLDLDSLPST